MRRIGGKMSGKSSGLTVVLAAVAASGAMICAPAAPSRAQDAGGESAARTAIDNTAGKTAAPRTAAEAAAISDAISRAIALRERDIRAAYYQELRANPQIAGEISVSFSVQPGGGVADVRTDRSTLNWPPLEERIVNAVKGWTFPSFEGEPVQATVPYKFGSN